MARVLLFGGTTEGRLLAEFCAESGIPVTLSVATPEGAARLPAGMQVLCGRMDAAQMRRILASGAYSRVVDATHPYAEEVTANLRTVCAELHVPYTRLLREISDIQGKIVCSMDELTAYLSTLDGIIFSTLGSKSLPALTQVRAFRERVWVRVLPVEGIEASCAALGYDPAHVIAQMPPFTVGDTLAHLRKSCASVLVTKESGRTGGYPEKCEAARIFGIPVVTLRRPAEKGLSLAEVQELLKEAFV